MISAVCGSPFAFSELCLGLDASPVESGASLQLRKWEFPKIGVSLIISLAPPTTGSADNKDPRI